MPRMQTMWPCEPHGKSCRHRPTAFSTLYCTCECHWSRWKIHREAKKLTKQVEGLLRNATQL